MWLELPTKGGRLTTQLVISPDGVNPAVLHQLQSLNFLPGPPIGFLFLPVFSDRWAAKVTQVDQVPD